MGFRVKRGMTIEKGGQNFDRPFYYYQFQL
jgi:hypothetical protein